jgi:plasmid maintenance system antidote protein VapI
MATQHTYSPDYAIAPGETLQELLDEKGISQADLSQRTGLAVKTINQIVNSSAPISLETADRFELALGVPASFWNKLELNYREHLARVEATARLADDVAWLKEVPYRDLIKRRQVPDNSHKPTLVREVLRFFGVSNVESWRGVWLEPSYQYRGGSVQKTHPAKVAAWLRIGELKADAIDCKPYDAKQFRIALNLLRNKFAAKEVKEWFPAMVRECANAGVAVVIVPSIPGASVSGATKWLSKDKAVIILSLKYKKDDHVWFTFFHEAAHVLLHGKKLVFVEDCDQDKDEMELEADKFARDILIPPSKAAGLVGLRSHVDIRAFAHSIGVAPGIVVGRLQRDGMPHHFCNDLKVTLEFPPEIN